MRPARLSSVPAALRSIPVRLARPALQASGLHIGIQFSRFAAVGVIGTLGHYTVLVALVHFGTTDPVLASSVGAVVGALLNYFLNYKFTFNSSAAHYVALPRFLLITILGFVINLLIIWWCIEVLALHYLLGQCVATGVVLLWNFGVNRAWTFAHGR